MKPFTFISAVVFWLIAVAHILRLFGGWEVTLNGMVVPLRVSVLGAVMAAGLAMMLWREMRKERKPTPAASQRGAVELPMTRRRLRDSVRHVGPVGHVRTQPSPNKHRRNARFPGCT
jgi:hypothetical protein